MLYHLLYPLHENFSPLNVFKYITFRTFVSLFTALVIYGVLGRWWIQFLKSKQFAQTIRSDGPESHISKKGTPTMGGVLVVGAVLLAVLLWGNWANSYIWICLFVFVSMGMVGLVDDYRKIIRKDPHGFPGRYKIVLEVVICLIAALWMYGWLGLETNLHVPFFKEVKPDISFWYLSLSILVIAGTANAVNLTDGLDGLVSVPAIAAFLTYGLFVYIVGNTVIAGYLQLPYVRDAGEVAIVCGAVVGALLGFLWFNTYPAEIFMGDVGALALGGLLGLVAMITKQELLLILIGGIFVLETLSVITQVVSFKLTGRRIFRMAPIHHHFELKGWKEPKIIVRFWIISFVLALLSLATLKLR